MISRRNIFLRSFGIVGLGVLEFVILVACNEEGRAPVDKSAGDSDNVGDTETSKDSCGINVDAFFFDTGTEEGHETVTEEECTAGGNWYDDSTGLCWQDPPNKTTLEQNHAEEYCNYLETGVEDNWRVPKIQELLSLMHGCANGMTSEASAKSQCGLEEPDCLSLEYCMTSPECDKCPYREGPGINDCYWPQELDPPCSKYYWSSSNPSGSIQSFWVVRFDYGMVYAALNEEEQYIRCVCGGQ
ncbi:MAG: DUF1566 domain-containing protein [Polyangia bacterium]